MADEVTIMELVEMIRSMDAPTIHARLTSDEIADAIEAHIAKQDKIIQAMAEYIAERNVGIEYKADDVASVIYCFERKVEADDGETETY